MSWLEILLGWLVIDALIIALLLWRYGTSNRE